MTMDALNRRSFLKGMSGAGMMSVLPGTAFGLHTVETDHIIHEVAGSGQDLETRNQRTRSGSQSVA